MPGQVEKLVRSLYQLGFVQREIARHTMVELGSQGFRALAVIHVDGPMRVSEIAERLSVDVSVASRQVNALVDAGYARRGKDEGDGRAHVISITTSGLDILAKCHRRLVEAFSQSLESWSDEEIGSLADRLDALRDDFSAKRPVVDADEEGNS